MLILQGSLPAQTPVKLSFSTGPSLNWMSTGKEEMSGGDLIAGYEFGLVSDFFLDRASHYAFTTGLLLNQTGGKLEYGNTESFSFAGKIIPPGSSIRYRLKYLEMPAAIKLKTSLFRRWAFWGQFGLSVFFNVGARGESPGKELDKTDIQDEIKRLNLAMNVGAGADYDLGADVALSVGLVFKDGLTDVTENHYNEGKTTVNSLQLKIGLIF
ncbi:MAG: outer membrane beta-barrel protein [Mangrovibacterium sp.]